MRMVALGKVADVNWGDTSVTKASYVENGFPAYSATGEDGFLPYYDFDREAIILSAIGARCGKTWFATGKWSVIKNTIRFWSESSDLDNRYLYWLTANPEFWPRRGAAQPFITIGDARKIEIPLPPLDEQKRIAAILDQADELRRKRKQALDHLNQLGQAIFYEMFGDRLKAITQLDECLADACHKITDGTHHSPDIQEVGIPYVTAKHLRPDGLDFFSNPWFISEEDHENIYSRCNPSMGDVLYIKDGATTGIAAINQYDFPFSMLSSLALLKLKRDVCLPEYLCAWLNNPIVKQYMTDSMSGAGITRLTLAKIKAAKFFIPKMNEQKKFAQKFCRLERQKKLESDGFIQLDSLFSSIQHRAFRGEL